MFFLRKLCLGAVLLALALLAGCRGQTPITETDFLLDTVVSVTVYSQKDAQAARACIELCRDYEKIFSRTAEDSELYGVNLGAVTQVSDDLAQAISRALYWCGRSQGRLDITMGGVSGLYGFSSDSPRVPSEEELAEALSHTGWQGITLADNTLTRADGETVIDLGATAKGYIADRLGEYLTGAGVERAIIDLGGNILCIGSKAEGTPFTVGIQHPTEGDGLIGTVELSDLAMVTSGVYQRCFWVDGRRWHHILDADTGLPVDNGLLSVTVIGPRAEDCDGLSTAVFAMGAEEGLALIDSLDGVWAVLVTDELEVLCSQGFEERFGPL